MESKNQVRVWLVWSATGLGIRLGSIHAGTENETQDDFSKIYKFLVGIDPHYLG